MAPYGAVYLTVRAVRAKTLKKEFGVGAEPQEDVIHCPGEVSPASAVMQVRKLSSPTTLSSQTAVAVNVCEHEICVLWSEAVCRHACAFCLVI